MENSIGIPLLVVGDFNGHIHCLGYQREDTNGAMIMEWLNHYNLSLLNINEKTRGVVTWERANQKSTIDYALANGEMHSLFQEMIIDENREVLDLSDHNLIEIKLAITSHQIRKSYSQESSDHYYISTKKEHLEPFRAELEAKIVANEISDMEQLNKIMEDTAELTLKRKYKEIYSGKQIKNNRKTMVH